MDKTQRNLWLAFLEEAKANRIYTAFAQRAMEENHPEVAQLFLEVAGAETVHAISHLKAIGQVQSTLENLRYVVQSEQFETGQIYPQMIQQALEQERTDAADTFRLAMDREHYHLSLFTEALRKLEEKLGPPQTAPLKEASVIPKPKPETQPAGRAESDRPPPKGLPEITGERKRIAMLQRVREVVFGMQDGLVSTVAIASSVMAATSHRPIVFIAGLTSALAGVISMGTGSYLSSKAEKDLHLAEIEKEAREIEANPEEEMAELIEIYRQEGLTLDEAQRLAERIASDRNLWLKTLAEKELGLTVDSLENPSKDAFTMAASFLVGSIVPLLPYLFMKTQTVITVSIGLTVAALFVVGVFKARITHRPPVRSGSEIMFLGGASGLLGYAIGVLIPKLLGIELSPY